MTNIYAISRQPHPVEAVYQATGEGLREFGNVESTMAMLFVQFMRPADPTLSLIVFDSVRHVEAKIRVLQSVGKQSLRSHDAFATTFNNLINRIGRRATVRNKIAHWVPNWWSPSGGTLYAVTAPQPSPEHEVRLTPPGMTGGNYSLLEPSDASLSVAEIRDFHSACELLYKNLIEFYAAISRLQD